MFQERGPHMPDEGISATEPLATPEQWAGLGAESVVALFQSGKAAKRPARALIEYLIVALRDA
jgi:hypothetical protein